ncbi:hypothetical protein ACFWD7_29680 [Streptomyces mirabilis]|uniref:hypothetical protein n=1 Tax=Streptomyces mirabilis TaxID=68239 RepID=UPI0036BB7CCC
MSRKLPLGEGETARTASAHGVLRAGVEEKTGEVLSAAVLSERVVWAGDLVSGMAADLLGTHWNTTDVDVLASGEDAGGRKLPSIRLDGVAPPGLDRGPGRGRPRQ